MAAPPGNILRSTACRRGHTAASAWLSRRTPSAFTHLIEAKEDGGLYRSDDGGETWDLVNGSHGLVQRAWYYMHVIADPQDAEHRLRGGCGVLQID